MGKYIIDTSDDAEDSLEHDNDKYPTDKTYGSSGTDSYKSSIYQQSDETISDESCIDKNNFPGKNISSRKY